MSGGSVNLCVLIGNLGKDPEIVGGKHGKIAKLSVATMERWKDKNTGEQKDITDWHSVVVFEQQSVEFAEKYLKKGYKVYVEGKQKTRKWEKEGVTHYQTEVVLSGFGSKLMSLQPIAGRGTPSEDDYGTVKTSDERPRSNASTSRDSWDDEIPF